MFDVVGSLFDVVVVVVVGARNCSREDCLLSTSLLDEVFGFVGVNVDFRTNL